MKKIFAILLVLAIMLSMAVPVFADGEAVAVNEPWVKYFSKEDIATSKDGGATVYTFKGITAAYTSAGVDIMPTLKKLMEGKDKITVSISVDAKLEYNDGFDGEDYPIAGLIRAVGINEKIKERAQKIGETVKEYVSKHLADLVDFEYKKGVLVLSEADAVASVAKYPWTWDSLSEEYKTILVFQTLINTNPRWFMNCKDLNKELLVSITKEQWVKIVLADYNAIKSVPAEYLNFVLKSIKENLNNNYGEDNSNKQS